MNHAWTRMRHSRDRFAGWPSLLAALLTVTLTGGPAGIAAAQSPAASIAAVPSVAPLPSPAPDALKVVTTTTVFADIVRNVAREHADVVSIIPPGVGPEDYEAKPEDAMLLADAALIVSNGVGLDDFLQKLLQSGNGGQTPQLVLGDGIPTLTVDGERNPHFWLDPSLVARYYVPGIIGALSTVDPAHGADYGANGVAYVTQLDALDRQLQDVVATIPEAKRKLVTFHDAFPYLAQHYGFELVGVILQNVGAEASAAELAALVEKVRSAGVQAVFSESQFNPRLAQTLADEAGITHLVTNLYTDSLGVAPADTYLGMLRYDIEQIATALR
jgi:ABC-type Zn uptake system ZnuABC Zn-binding protein ZnuA